jgi:hypothetical protein
VSTASRFGPARSLALTILTAASTVMVGAASDTGESLARLRRMSPEQRSQLEAKLRRFEQVLSPDQQKALRAIDDRIGKLPSEEGQHYLAVLRRYRNWLNSLPETVKTSYQSRPESERIAQIKSLSARYPIPTGISPRWIWIADGGSASLVELAAIFKVWAEMTPEQKREVENPPAGKRRLELLLRNPRGNRTLREILPADFDEEEWTTKAESALREFIILDPEVRDAMIKAKAEMARLKGDHEGAIEKVRRNRLRRVAINLYFQEHPPRPVDPANLDRFRAAFPAWIQATFDSLPPDEARRRLTIVYRLVYPSGEFREPAGGRQKSAQPVNRSAGPGRPPNPPSPPPVRPRDPAPATNSRPSSSPF